MAYKSVVLEDSVTINRIISVHYFQYMSDFSFPGKAMTSGNWYAWTEVKLMRWQETGV